MPGDRKHHTEKFRRCVEQVMDKGNDESSAYAICTTSLQDAGESIFEAAAMHSLHLLGATGQTRTEMYNNRPHLVVPVVALMEGVIHAVNAETPEFVPLSTLEKAAATWNKRPAVLFHPKRDGKQCSANSPDIIESHGIGYIFNSRVEGKKLLCEAWLDKEKTQKLHSEMFDRLLAGKTEEVSVGAYVVTDDKPGNYNGKIYNASWIEAVGDHLAFLPGARGACSVEMGCGTHRAAMHQTAMRMLEDGMVLEELKAKYQECSTCKGTGSKDGNPCEACDGVGELKVASNTPVDRKVIAAAAPKPQLKAAGCGCKDKQTGVRTMANATRAEVVAALVTDRFSGFKDGDEAMLETASDARLDEFRAAADNRRAAENSVAQLNKDLTSTSARLKVAEDRLKASEATLSEDDFIARAPEGIKTLLEAHKQQEAQHRAGLISRLKECGANTETELKAKSTTDLETLAAYAQISVPDYSGRGIPKERHASEKDTYAPPDPYAAGLAAMRGGSKAVN